MGRKTGKEKKLLLAEPEDLQALIERAQQANGVTREGYTAPAWYQIGRLWREKPCRRLDCSDHCNHYWVNRWDKAMMFVVCGAL